MAQLAAAGQDESLSGRIHSSRISSGITPSAATSTGSAIRCFRTLPRSVSTSLRSLAAICTTKRGPSAPRRSADFGPLPADVGP
ncbi:MAG: hypothetical protein OXG91_14170 [bacterium]|nr:hypothetical protein [bacterium]